MKWNCPHCKNDPITQILPSDVLDWFVKPDNKKELWCCDEYHFAYFKLIKIIPLKEIVRLKKKEMECPPSVKRV